MPLGRRAAFGHFAGMAIAPSPDPAEAGAELELGRRLIGLADSFEKFDEAVRLIEKASAAGHAEAACMLATLEAVGAGRPRNWKRALDYLELAGERGSEHAQGQLKLLAASGDSSDWRGARGRISVERLLAAPAPKALAEKPRLRVFERFASAAECRWVIERLRPKLHPAVVWDVDSGETLEDPYRSNRSAELPVQDMDVAIEVLRARISAATRIPEFVFELPQLMHYRVGEEFRPHHDYIDPDKPGLALDLARRGQRIGTFLLYLNDAFAGGATEFPQAGIAYRGRTGDALFFANVTPDGRPDPLTLHAGRSPSSGEKWILSQWIRDRVPGETAPARAPG